MESSFADEVTDSYPLEFGLALHRPDEIGEDGKRERPVLTQGDQRSPL